MKEHTKSITISRQLVYDSYLAVKRNRGTSGIDGQSISDFELNLKDNLYKLWNRMSSGSYFPTPVKEVLIPKRDGKMRPLGIPTVTDRIAQTVVKKLLEERLEKRFHRDSYGCRANKSAHMALRQCRRRCWESDWVIDLDIKGFFENISHDLLNKAINQVVTESWIRLYLNRWMKSGVFRDGEVRSRIKGTPQGGVISPLLANLFLHYVFDKWMERYYSEVKFERYAEIHCKSEQQSKSLYRKIKQRFTDCHLELNERKSKIVYCKDSKRQLEYPNITFEFLGYSFRRRFSANKKGMYYVGFLPSPSKGALNAIKREIKSWKLQNKVKASLEDIGNYINPKLRGWINYYSLFQKRGLRKAFTILEYRILKWVRSKYKRLRTKRRSVHWIKKMKMKYPKLLATAMPAFFASNFNFFFVNILCHFISI